MNNEFREQMYNELKLRETEDLLEIWRANDRAEWSDTAFEVIKEILAQRHVEVPVQEEAAEKEEASDDGLEGWEAKLLDDENQPAFYDTLEVLNLRDNINRVAIGAVVVSALLGISHLQFVSALLQGVHVSASEELRALPWEIYTILSTVLNMVVVYFPLKALAQILRILMEMEFRSRKGI